MPIEGTNAIYGHHDDADAIYGHHDDAGDVHDDGLIHYGIVTYSGAEVLLRHIFFEILSFFPFLFPHKRCHSLIMFFFIL